MTQVGVPCLAGGIIVDVDDIIEHAHGSSDRLLKQGQVEAVLLDMKRQPDGTEIADGRLVGGGVQEDLRAKVRTVDDSHVILWRTHIGGVFKSNPGMSGLEYHGKDPAPEGGCLDSLEQGNFTPVGHGLVLDIALLKSTSVKIVKVGHVTRAEESPLAVLLDSLHEEIRDPIGSVHVMGSPALVANILAQLEKILDVEVPCLKVGAHGPLALAALIDRHGSIVCHFEEGNDSLAFPVGSLDQGTSGTDIRPIVAQSTSPFRKLRIVADAFEYVIEIVHHRCQVAGTQLGMESPAVEKSRRR